MVHQLITTILNDVLYLLKTPMYLVCEVNLYQTYSNQIQNIFYLNTEIYVPLQFLLFPSRFVILFLYCAVHQLIDFVFHFHTVTEENKNKVKSINNKKPTIKLFSSHVLLFKNALSLIIKWIDFLTDLFIFDWRISNVL